MYSCWYRKVPFSFHQVEDIGKSRSKNYPLMKKIFSLGSALTQIQKKLKVDAGAVTMPGDIKFYQEKRPIIRETGNQVHFRKKVHLMDTSSEQIRPLEFS